MSEKNTMPNPTDNEIIKQYNDRIAVISKILGSVQIKYNEEFKDDSLQLMFGLFIMNLSYFFIKAVKGNEKISNEEAVFELKLLFNSILEEHSQTKVD